MSEALNRRIADMTIMALIEKFHHVSDRVDAIECLSIIMFEEWPRILKKLSDFKDDQIAFYERAFVDLQKNHYRPPPIIVSHSSPFYSGIHKEAPVAVVAYINSKDLTEE